MKKQNRKLGCNFADIDRIETYNPKNREVAFAFQIHDSVQVLYACAHTSPEHFENQLRIIETFIKNYRNNGTPRN